jgi:hypothetical protein
MSAFTVPVEEEHLALGLRWLELALRAAVEPQADRGAARAAYERFIAAEAVTPDAPLLHLGDTFGLTRFERHVLLLCAAVERDETFLAHCARAQPALRQPYPTWGLALRVLPESTTEALAPERPLRYWKLIESNQGSAHSLLHAPIRIDERILNALHGLHYLDDRLDLLVKPLPPPRVALAPSQRKVEQELLTQLTRRDGWARMPVIQLAGTDGASKRLLAQAAAAAVGREVYELALALLPRRLDEVETFCRLWQREQMLLPLAPYVDLRAVEGRAERQEEAEATLSLILARTDCLFFLDVVEPRAEMERPFLVADVRKPTAAEQQAWWSARLELPRPAVAPLAQHFDLDLARIQDIALAARAVTGGDDALFDAAWQVCLTQCRPRLHALAERVDARATWDDIVLPDEAVSLLRQVEAQVRERGRVYDEWGFRARMNRGMGISVLFGGQSGTGKTMAAEVLANALRLDLYRIDLSMVVNKYIGETEKNLRRLFDAAEEGGCILFFDEADAVFGKRSEVKDSHDRYANIEINYLLQRLETYTGLAILATNRKDALDQAFLRRLRFIVTFPFPDAAGRAQIWRKAFPPGVPRAELDYPYLSRLNLSGGNIHAAALNAAFLAAADGAPVSMCHVLQAARTEYRKLDLPILESLFQVPEAAS